MSGKIVLWLIAVTGIAIIGVAWWAARAASHSAPVTRASIRSRSVPATSATKEQTDPIMDRIVHSGPMAMPRDAFRVIDRPKYSTIEAAAASMSDQEVVLGLELAGEFRAYPINYLNDHEMLREEIGGVPILVTW